MNSILSSVVPVVISKLKEGSTWSGLGAVIGSVAFIPHASEIGALVPTVGVFVSGLLSIWFK